jgi:hypothetical protein
VRPYLKNTDHKKGLGEWLKVNALSSSLSTEREREREGERERERERGREREQCTKQTGESVHWLH